MRRLFFLFFFIMIIPFARAETEALRPNADGQYTEWIVVDSTHSGATSDESDSTWVNTSTGEAREVLNLDNPTFGDSDTINSVQVNLKCRALNGGAGPEKVNLMMRTEGVDCDTDVNIALADDTFTDIYGTVQTLDCNGVSWTKENITNLQAGVRLTSIDANEIAECSEIWVIVDYTPYTTTSTSTSTTSTTSTTDPVPGSPGAYSNIWFLVIQNCESFQTQTVCEAYGCYWYDDSCHSSPEGIEIEICTVKIPLSDDTELCITDDGEMLLLVTSSFTIVTIPFNMRKKIIKRLRR